jgi:hypothetical protein
LGAPGDRTIEAQLRAVVVAQPDRQAGLAAELAERGGERGLAGPVVVAQPRRRERERGAATRFAPVVVDLVLQAVDLRLEAARDAAELAYIDGVGRGNAGRDVGDAAFVAGRADRDGVGLIGDRA